MQFETWANTQFYITFLAFVMLCLLHTTHLRLAIFRIVVSFTYADGKCLCIKRKGSFHQYFYLSIYVRLFYFSCIFVKFVSLNINVDAFSSIRATRSERLYIGASRFSWLKQVRRLWGPTVPRKQILKAPLGANSGQRVEKEADAKYI